MKQNRFRSPVVWAAVAAQASAILVLLGVIGQAMSDTIRTGVTALLEILVLVGFLNNPTDGEGF
ncbi:MAG: hypothetical protein FWF69_07840 [Firmicutes bacterium]|nr:hypothetical protein [Bacillota bacterium]